MYFLFKALSPCNLFCEDFSELLDPLRKHFCPASITSAPGIKRADLILSSLSSLGLGAVMTSAWRFAGLTHKPFSSTLQKLQDMDERRATRLGAGYGLLSEAELQVVPIIGKCLEGMKVAAESVDAKNVGTWRGPSGMECELREGGP